MDNINMPPMHPLTTHSNIESTTIDNIESLSVISTFRNHLLGAASKILSAITQLKQTHLYQNPEKLASFLQSELLAFQKKAKQHKYEDESIFIGQYVLSAALDEIIEKTPWGSKSNWRTVSLLKQETKQQIPASERFFIILKSICQTPKKFIDLIELMYICLSLGFEGQYKNIADGKQQLDQIKDSLYHIIRHERGEFIKQLSPNIKKLSAPTKPKKNRLKAWKPLILSIVILGGVYISTLYFLNTESAKVIQQLQSTINMTTNS